MISPANSPRTNRFSSGDTLGGNKELNEADNSVGVFIGIHKSSLAQLRISGFSYLRHASPSVLSN